jgi:hypothetical protein
MMDDILKIVGKVYDHKVFYADPHDMERAKMYGELIHAEQGLAFYIWRGITYVAPVDDPPMLRYIKGGRDP